MNYACDGKVRFTADAAHKMAHRAHDGRSAYRCVHCGWHHVGNTLHRSTRKNAGHRRKHEQEVFA